MTDSTFKPFESEHSSQANSLPVIHRYITTHSPRGTAIFDHSISASAKWRHLAPNPEVPPMASFFLAYTTSGFPIEVNPSKDDQTKQPQDLVEYRQKLSEPVSNLIDDDASVLRYVDFAPQSPPFMHRTKSVDYGIVIEGEIELILDSGEKRLLKRGDSCVQRATMHAWRNTSDTEWARMVFILISSTLPRINDEHKSPVMPSL